LLQRVRDLGLTNVVMWDGVPHEAVPELMAAADICLVPLRDIQLFRMFIPSKIFEYLGAGKAVVGSVAGEAAEILAAAGAVIVKPEESDELAYAIRELAHDPDRRKEMGLAGRAYVTENYDRAHLATRYLSLLRQLSDIP
ncbi:MAG: glycosyltransferase, partial [Actinobacteria bacterium]|nr:glycosyltransferase [Actinomycetota bacterium]